MNTVEAIELIEREGQRLCPAIREGETIIDPGFQVDDENREVVTSAAAWLAREPRQNIDLGKGLLVMGNVGTGKTLLLRAVRGAMMRAYGSQFGIRPCGEMVRAYSEDGYDGIDAWMIAPHVCFDDLGTEGEGIHFGKRTNLMAEVIEARYDRMQQGRKCWTHITTNLGTPDLKKHLGDRAFSRLRHMCNLLTLGTDGAAVDRRASARGFVPPPASPNADNIYSAVHPDIAAKLLISIAPVIEAARAITAKPAAMKVVGDTQEDHLGKFIATIHEMNADELNTLRDKVEKGNSSEVAAPYLKAIDDELELRKSTAHIPAA